MAARLLSAISRMGRVALQRGPLRSVSNNFVFHQQFLRKGLNGSLVVGIGASTFLGSYAYCEANTEKVIDYATGLAFDKQFQISPDVGCPVVLDFELMGTGCRYKYGYVKVYAVGLYISSRQVGIGALHNGEEALNSILNGKLQGILSVKLARELTTDTLVTALKTAIEPLIIARGIKDGIDVSKDLEGLAVFATTVSNAAGQTMSSGTDMSFFWSGHAKDELLIEVNQKSCPRIKGCPILCWALYETYLGANAVSPEARTNFIKGISNKHSGNA